MPTTRIHVPSPVDAGTAIEIKTLIMHPMESGRRQDSMGNRLPRRIIHRFDCRFNGAEVIAIDLQPGIAANPLISFVMMVNEPGELTFRWHDDDGSVHVETAAVEVAGA
ncbi:MAG: thiosulfate oxidation carrier complex protein SoxZ, partial [Parahaliea sp.]